MPPTSVVLTLWLSMQPAAGGCFTRGFGSVGGTGSGVARGRLLSLAVGRQRLSGRPSRTSGWLVFGRIESVDRVSGDAAGLRLAGGRGGWLGAGGSGGLLCCLINFDGVSRQGFFNPDL